MLLLLLSLPASACLWDSDTLAAERAGLPGVYDAIMGLYPRRTREYYQRRVERIEAAGGPSTPEAYDDLAVAHERLGDNRRAVALMAEKDERWPGLYTTWANLGTFHAHAGRFADGAAAVRRAIAINPDAHFGREPYQLMAIEFLARAQDEPKLLTTHNILGIEVAEVLGPGFRHLAPRTPLDGPGRAAILAQLGLGDDALEGLVGMMVLAQAEAPDLYFALAELLAAMGDRRLAWHAYQRAVDLGHPRAVDIRWYQQQTIEALPDAERRDLTPVAHWKVRRRALAWGEAYQAFERELIAGGGDPTDPEALAPFFEEHPKP